MHSEARMLDLVGQIYDAALNPQLWDNFLGSLSTELKSPGSIFLVQNIQSGHLLLGRSAGLEPEGVQAYEDYYVTVDPRIPRLMKLPSGTFGPESSFVPKETWQRSELVNDFLLPIDFYYALNGVVLKNELILSTIGVQRQKRHGAFSEREVKFMHTIGPHLERAVQMTLRFIQADTQQRNCAHLLNLLPMGVILTDQESQIIHTNDAAKQILDQNDGVGRYRHRLGAATSHETKTLRGLIYKASETTQAQGFGSGGAMPVSRPSMLRSFAVLVTPLPHDEYGTLKGNPTAAVFVTDPEEETETQDQILIRLYQLTPAEAKLAMLLMQGISLDAAADELQIAKGTARVHMRNIFSKTDTHRQSELVRLLLNGAAKLRTQ